MRRAAALLLSAAAAGCAGPDVVFNPNQPVARVRRVAVAPFQGRGGPAAADLFAHALLASGADVVERSRLESVLAEHQLSAAGALDPSTVRRIGSLLGVDALFVGSVTQYEPPQSYLVFPASSPQAGSAARVGRGRRLTPGPGPAPGVEVVTADAVVGLTARMVDVETGSVLWSARQSYEGFDVDSAMSAIASGFARTLAHLWR